MSEHILLEKLRYRARDSRRATAIAEYFRWPTSGPVEKWARGNRLQDMREAEELGAAIATEFYGPGRWWRGTSGGRRWSLPMGWLVRDSNQRSSCGLGHFFGG
jgi:hypothetical protein